MSDPRPDADTLERVARIDGLCDRFESLWQAGGRPSAAEFLRAAGVDPGSAMLDLVQELGRVEDYYRAAGRPGPASTVTHAPGAAKATPPAGGSGATRDFPLDRPPGPGPGAGYHLGPVLGRGGMGVVYRAADPAIGREVAVKVLDEPHRTHPGAARRFLTEARVTGRLQHPGIPPVFQVGSLPDGSPFLAMKLIEGRTLAAALAAADRPDPAALVTAFEHVCQAVGYAHSKGVIHRDLKPSNVMVGAFGEVQVMDWGLAKVLGEPGVGSDDPGASGPEDPVGPQPRTRAGSVLGTLAYMAPEQARGETGRVDERADVFGLGAILCEILTGAPPFVGVDGPTILRLAEAGAVADAFGRLDRCGADPALAALCRRCLAADRDERPRDAGAVAAAVAGLRAAAEERARKAELNRARAEVRLAEERRRRVRRALTAAVGLLLLGGSGFLWWADRQAVAAAAAAERVREGVLANLALAADLRAKYRFAEAAAALEQAAGLIPADGPADLRVAVQQAAADLAFVRELDEIRMRRSTWIAEEGGRGGYDTKSAPRAYRKAFADQGLAVTGGDPDAVAAAVRGSAVKADLVAALDDWAVYEPDARTRDRVLGVARRADPGPWLDRFRDPAVRSSRLRLAWLAWSADPAALAPGTATALAELMGVRGLDPEPVLLAAQFAHPGDFPIAFTLGQLARRRHPDEAIARYRTARAIRADNYALLINLGSMLCDEKRDYVVAAASFRGAIRLDPRSAQAHTNLGNALRGQGHLDDAVESHRRAIRLDPGFALAHTNLGSALRQQGQLDDAVASFRRAIELNPKLVIAYKNLGALLCDEKRDYVAAAAIFREAIELDPRSAQAHTNLGYALRGQGPLDDAAASFRRTIELDPTHAPAHTGLGSAFKDRDEPAAIASYRRAIELNPRSAQAHTNLGNALHRQGHLGDAVASFRRTIELDPGYARAHTNLGSTLQDWGELAAAVESHREAIRLDPTYAPAHNNLGIALQAKGDLNEAANCFREAIPP